MLPGRANCGRGGSGANINGSLPCLTAQGRASPFAGCPDGRVPMRTGIVAALFALLLGVMLLGCAKNPGRPGYGQVVLRMTDAPAALEAVNLVVKQVSIHRAGDEGEREGEDDDSLEVEVDDDSLDVDDDSTEAHEGGWEVLSEETRTFDLLQLRNGVLVTLATGTVPVGHYTQIRLKLGSGSNVV